MIGYLLNIYFYTSFEADLATTNLNPQRSLAETFRALFFSGVTKGISVMGSIFIQIRFGLQQYWPISNLEGRQLTFSRSLFHAPTNPFYSRNAIPVLNRISVNRMYASWLELSSGNILNQLQFFNDQEWERVWDCYRLAPTARWDLFQQIDFSSEPRRALLNFVLQQNPDYLVIECLFRAMLATENFDIAQLYSNRAHMTRNEAIFLANYPEQIAIINLIWPNGAPAPEVARAPIPAPAREAQPDHQVEQPVEPEYERILNDDELALHLEGLAENEVDAFLERQRTLRLRHIAAQERPIPIVRTQADIMLDDLRAIFNRYAQNREPQDIANAVISEDAMQEAIRRVEATLVANIEQAVQDVSLNSPALETLVSSQSARRHWERQISEIMMQIIFDQQEIELPEGGTILANQRFIQDLEYLQGLFSDVVHRRLTQTLEEALQRAIEQKRLAEAQALARQQEAELEARQQAAAARLPREELRRGAVPLQFADQNHEQLRRERITHEINQFYYNLNKKLVSAFVQELQKHAVMARFRNSLLDLGGDRVCADTVRQYIGDILRDGTYINIFDIFASTQESLQAESPEAYAWTSDDFATTKDAFLARSGERYEAFFEMLVSRIIAMPRIANLIRGARPVIAFPVVAAVDPSQRVHNS